MNGRHVQREFDRLGIGLDVGIGIDGDVCVHVGGHLGLAERVEEHELELVDRSGVVDRQFGDVIPLDREVLDTGMGRDGDAREFVDHGVVDLGDGGHRSGQRG